MSKKCCNSDELLQLIVEYAQG